VEGADTKPLLLQGLKNRARPFGEGVVGEVKEVRLLAVLQQNGEVSKGSIIQTGKVQKGRRSEKKVGVWDVLGALLRSFSLSFSLSLPLSPSLSLVSPQGELGRSHIKKEQL